MRYELVYLYRDSTGKQYEEDQEFEDFDELLQYLEENRANIKQLYRCTRVEDVDISYLGFTYNDI